MRMRRFRGGWPGAGGVGWHAFAALRVSTVVVASAEHGPEAHATPICVYIPTALCVSNQAGRRPVPKRGVYEYEEMGGEGLEPATPSV